MHRTLKPKESTTHLTRATTTPILKTTRNLTSNYQLPTFHKTTHNPLRLLITHNPLQTTHNPLIRTIHSPLIRTIHNQLRITRSPLLTIHNLTNRYPVVATNKTMGNPANSSTEYMILFNKYILLFINYINYM